MKHPKILLVFYSATGHTRAIADEIAAELGATIVQISCPSLDRGGFLTARRLLSALTRSKPDISLSSSEAVEEFDLVLIGGPVWAAKLATPVCGYIEQVAHRLPEAVGVFISSGSSATSAAMNQWIASVGKQPIARLSVCDDDRVTGHHIALIQEYVAALKTQLAFKGQGSAKQVSV